ncbi:MAG TPA: DUF4340 domain-containing protein [Polyangia bacterium]|nr:DUF4340 domain-containing protein [Polyangia bacterium]
MNVRGAAVQSGLAALGLVVAYTTWQREPERAPGEVVVVDVNKGDVQKVRFDDGNGKTVEMESHKEGGEEPRVWLKLSADAKAKKPAREVPGNEGAERLWEKFAPLRATRALGTMSADKLKELGLDAPKKHLEVTARGVMHRFDVGSSPFGVSDPYVKDVGDGHVYVLGGSVVNDLEAAGVRFVDRALHGFKPGDYDSVTISAGGKSRTLSAPPAENAFAIKLINPKTNKPDEMAKNWHDKLWRLMVTDVLGKGEMPSSGTPEVACKVEYSWKGKSKGFVELGRTAPSSVASNASPTGPGEQWARSERTASWDKLPGSADELMKECLKVAAGE